MSPAPSEPEVPRIYVIHHEQDQAAAEVLATALQAHYGLRVWFEGWEIVPGHNRVLEMQEGLRKAHGAVVLLSEHGLGQRWAREQYAAILDTTVEGSTFMIPVLRGQPAELPAFLRTRAPADHEDHEVIVRAVFRHMGYDFGDAPALGRLWAPRPPVRVDLQVLRDGETVRVRAAGLEGSIRLPREEAQALRAGLRTSGLAKDARVRTASHNLDRIGQRLAEVFDGALGEHLARTLRPGPQRGPALVSIRSAEPALLGLPWEAAPLPGHEPLALIDEVATVRELDVQEAPSAAEQPAVPGPLRILVTVASPDDDLGVEREQEVILDAAERTRIGRGRVVFAEDGTATLDGLRRHLDAEPFHVLHLSAHGAPGTLQLEDAEGHAVTVTGEALADVLREARHCPPVVVLSSCHGGDAVDEVDRIALAPALLSAGVAQVVAMQGPVGDGYATELAARLYAELAGADEPVVVGALARARRGVEAERLRRLQQGERYAADVPEYATPVVITAAGLAGSRLYDGTRPCDPPAEPPVQLAVPGLPGRPLGWVVGRRRLRREVRKAVIERRRPGAILWGMGGTGKSTLAVGVCEQLQREGYGVAVVVGVFSLAEGVRTVVRQLDEQGVLGRLKSQRVCEGVRAWQRASASGTPVAEDELLALLRALIQDERVVLLLDNFEDNLAAGHGPAPGLPAEIEPDQPLRAALPTGLDFIVEQLIAAADRGALLVTCRYRLRDCALKEFGLGPLRANPRRRLVWRLPGLMRLPDHQRREALTMLGGHPRVLEFADALLRARPEAWDAAFADIRTKLEGLAERAEAELPHEADEAPEHETRISLATRLAATDVLLPALLGTLDEPAQRFLRAIAVYRRGVPDEALDAVARAEGLEFTPQQRKGVIERLRSRTLLADGGKFSRYEGGKHRKWQRSYVVHRWTATALHADAVPVVAHGAAADWWITPEQLAWDDAMEGVEHLLAAQRTEEATNYAEMMRRYASQSGQNLAALRLSERMVEALEIDTREYALWLGTSAGHLQDFGEIDLARQRFEKTLAICEQLVDREPGRSDLQRDLSVSYNKLGDLHIALGNGEQARRYFEDSLAIAQQLVDREPGRSDLQRDLSVSFERLGDLHRALGNGEQARRYFEADLAIAQQLVDREPDRSDLQRDLSVSFERLGDLHRALGNGEQARRYFEDSLNLRQQLVDREPGRSDLQRDLSVSYNKLGDLHIALGNGEQARRYFEDSLAIAQQLVDREPGRSDLQRDLSVSYNKLGDLHIALGNGEQARRYFEDSLAIAQQLVDREPGRSDLQRDLSVSFERLGDLHIALGNGEQARRYFEDSLNLRQQLVDREPGRSDLQRDLSVSFERLGDLHRALGNGEQARRYFEDSLNLRQQLVDREPGRSDLQLDLSVSFERLGDLHIALGNGEQARRYFEDSLNLRQQLVDREPGRSDLQRDLSVSYNKLGDLHIALGNGEQARRYFEDSLNLRQQLVDREPGRSDLQRDLSVSYNKLGNLHIALGNGEQARRYFEDSLNLRQQLVDREPGRSDLQRDLSVSYNKLGDLHIALGNGEQARRYFEDSLAIFVQLVDREPGRSDLQRDLSVSYNKLGDLHIALGNGEQAHRYFEDSLNLRQQLVDREPGRSDLQRDLAISYERMATVDDARSITWLEQAVEIHRRRLAREQNNVITQRELGISLVQFGQAVGRNDTHKALESLHEAYSLLRALKDRNALEAQYLPTVDRLEQLFTQRSP